ncbi:hypothetical protein EMIT0196MI5_110158 [Pseudomonas sp. IT-196MI5]
MRRQSTNQNFLSQRLPMDVRRYPHSRSPAYLSPHKSKRPEQVGAFAWAFICLLLHNLRR